MSTKRAPATYAIARMTTFTRGLTKTPMTLNTTQEDSL